MSDSTVIKEFLVALGFKVDEAKLKKFTQGIDTTTKFVGKLGLGVATMATAVEAAVVKVSSTFEDLYYASKRIGDTVADIRGFSFAMGQVGSTGKAGLQAMENVAEFLRSYPGGARFLQGLGVDLKFVDGQAQVTSETMEQLAGVLRAMPYARAKVYAGVLGIDPNALQAMLRGTGEAQKRFHDLAQRMGVDQDKAAQASKDFMNDLRELLAVVTLTFDKIILKVQPISRDIIRSLEDLDEATDGWSTSLAVVAAFLVPLLLLLDPIVGLVFLLGAAIAGISWAGFAADSDDALGSLSQMKDALDKLWEAIKSLVAAFPPDFWEFLIKEAQAWGGVLNDVVLLALHLITNALNVVAGVIRLVSNILHGEWKAAWNDAKGVALDSLKTIRDALYDTGKTIADTLFPKSFQDRKKPEAAAPGAPAPAANDNPVAAAHGAVDGVAAKIQQFFEANGFNRTQAAGITAGVYAETAHDPKAFNGTGGGQGAFGLGQWRGARLANLRKRYGQHPTVEQQLQFMLWELTHDEKEGGEASGGRAIRSATTSSAALAAYIRQYMRPGNGTIGDLQRGMRYLNSNQQQTTLNSGRPTGPAQGATINQKTEIHVHGGDPQSTARAVANEQGRVNDALARNLKSAAS